MNRDLRSQLKSFSTLSSMRVRPEWQAHVKARLEITPPGAPRQAQPVSRIASASRFVSFVLPRPVAVFARVSLVYFLIIGVAVYGWGVSVSAAESSLPGDLLYGVKKANERKELLLAGNNGEKVVVLLNHAAKRADELKKIQASSDTTDKKQARAKTVVLSLKENIKSTNEEIQKVKTSPSADPAALLSVVSEKTSQIATDLSTSVTIGSPQTAATDLSAAVKTEVAAVANLVVETNVNAVVTAAQIIVSTPASTEQSTQVVNETFEKALVNLESTFSALQSMSSSTATGTLPVVVTPVSTTVSSTVSSTVGTATGTSIIPVVVSTASTTVTSTPVTEETVQAKVEAAVQAVADAKVLLSQENLRGAIEKVQTVLDLKKEIEVSVNPQITLKAYSAILPQSPPYPTAVGDVPVVTPTPTMASTTVSSTSVTPPITPAVR